MLFLCLFLSIRFVSLEIFGYHSGQASRVSVAATTTHRKFEPAWGTIGLPATIHMSFIGAASQWGQGLGSKFSCTTSLGNVHCLLVSHVSVGPPEQSGCAALQMCCAKWNLVLYVDMASCTFGPFCFFRV